MAALRPRFRGLFLALAGCLLASAAQPHGARAPENHPGGVPIASLEHGQMAVLARHRGEILALAARHYPVDETLRRLTNHAEIQFAYCLWGLMPGTVTDAASPFNGCAHAYLATAREALLRLESLPGKSPAVDGLRQRIDADMLANGRDLDLCQHSGEEFGTGRIVGPDWGALPGHWPSLLAVLALPLAAIAAMAALRRPRRTLRA